jgi:diaminohydroxyphosphoribosylaminopyrimidine deaminase / 5-amino-6-(5-phosphoribosylamino)uracil reductase
MDDQFFLRKTFELARRALGQTWPNPLVGAVIVKDGKIIGEGFHRKAGTDHAELAAIKNATESCEGATIYVNLEPCCHTNKLTPPCAQRLIQEKFKRVVISNIDPNPAVSGNGVELLRAARVQVDTGLLSEEGERLNEVFFLAQRKKRPFVHLKLASTLDGKIARLDGESQWITGPEAREYVHVLRSQSQGVIVGAQTLRLDNPKLNVRTPGYAGPQPARIIFSRSGDLPSDSHLFQDELKEKTLLYTQRPSKLLPPSQVIEVNNLEEALADLFSRKIISVFLEGGSHLASEFFKANLVDRVSLFLNPSFLGSGIPSLQDLGIKNLQTRPRLSQTTSQWIADDLLISGRIIQE